MRVFIGIDFPIAIKEKLYERALQIKQTATSGNFSRLDLYHLTLNFIGEVTEKQCDEICRLMDAVAKRHGPFVLKFGGIGSFPSRGKHIVFNEVAGDLKALKALQEELERKLIEAEYPVDASRRYKPHITLGREVKTERVSLLKPLIPIPDEVFIDQIILFESTRIHGELHYLPLHQTALKGPISSQPFAEVQ